MATTKTEAAHIRLPVPVYKKLTKRAKEVGVPFSTLLRMILVDAAKRKN